MSAQILHFERVKDAPNRIRELRMARGWSQQRLADAINMTKMNLSEIERGNVTLNINHMRLIARVFGLSPAELLNEHDNAFLLDEEEAELIERRRHASDEDRAKFSQVAEVMLPYIPPPSKAANDGSKV